MTKDEIADVLDEVGTLLELQGENPFRTRAYHNGARAVRQLDGSLDDLITNGQLANAPGIGDTLRDKIVELAHTGRLAFHEDLKASLPAGLPDLLRLPSVGPKKVKALWESLGIDSLAALKAACEAGQVAELKGFGAKTQAKILEGIAFLDTIGHRALFARVYPLGLALLEQLRGLPGVFRAELCGSLRRRRETAKDIDLLVSSDNPGPIMDHFVGLPQVLRVIGRGDTKASVVVADGEGPRRMVVNADLRVVSDEQFPFALNYFTGSQAHNIAMRRRAEERGLKLNEYALAGAHRTVACADEPALYAALGFDYIPPELREDTGELDAAEKHTLPRLIEPGDVRGVFHNHTTASDGTASLEEMALAAKALGLTYLGIADHSQSLTIANGLSPERLREQIRAIDEVNHRLTGIRLLKGTECDILPDGSLDYDDELLGELDYVVASVHTHFGQSADEMTGRVCRALAHPRVTMLGHATGRLLTRRAGYKIDLDRVLATAARYGKMIEINAQPDRLDLDWVYCKRAKALGVPLVINPDAHAPGELGLYPLGVNVARRGWLEAKDVFNTRPLNEVLKALGRA